MNVLEFLQRGEELVKEAEKKIAEVKKDSRAAQNPKDYIDANRSKIIAELKKGLEENATERKKHLMKNIDNAQADLDRYVKPSKTGLENVHYMRAERIVNAKTIEEARATYRRNVGRLTKSERKDLRWIYDDGLREAIALIQPAAEYLGEQTIEEFWDDDEKRYDAEVKLQYQMKEQFKGIDGMIEAQADALAAGEEPVKYDWIQIVDEAITNAERNIRGPAPMPEIEVNPYDAEEGEVEAAAAE